MNSVARDCRTLPTDRPAATPAARWSCRDREFPLGPRPLIMGILNVTPDSFSDGGQYLDVDRAIARGVEMAEQGADIIDVGGESTRPGAPEVPVEEERARVIPVIQGLRKRTGAGLSIDTTKAGVAREALDAGAHIINDVSALTGDAGMAAVARESGAGVILMHMQGTPRTMQQDPRYGNVVREVAGYLAGRVEALRREGLSAAALAIDPGIGFGKTLDHNLELLAGLEALTAIGCPVVVGLSRKSLIGKITGRGPGDRLAGSLAGLVFCMLKGAHVLRVHDVQESLDAVRIIDRICQKERP